MSKESVIKHSLWLTAPDLQIVVDELASEAGNPTFTPHITLIGNYLGTNKDAMDIADKIAKSFNRQLTLDFSGFDTKNEEFRFFCLLAKPSNELDSLYGCVYEAYKPSSIETFKAWPHVSLLYGTESAKSVFSDLEKLLSRYANSLDGSRTFSEIVVLDTSGNVEDWKSIGSVALAQSSGMAR